MQRGNGDAEDFSNEEREKIGRQYFRAGDKVREFKWNSDELGAEYTIGKIEGEMNVEKKIQLPISQFEGAELIVNTGEPCPATSTAGDRFWGTSYKKVTVKSGKLMITAERSDSLSSCKCPKGFCERAKSTSTPPTWADVPETEVPKDKGISFYIAGLGSGDWSPDSPDTFGVSNHATLRPNMKGSNKKLMCFDYCINGTKLATAAQGSSVTYQRKSRIRSRENAHMYTFNEQTGMLIDDASGVPVSKAYQEGNTRSYGWSMELVEATAATIAELGCADSATKACNSREASTVYRWSTGSKYATVNFLTDAAGSVRMPTREINLNIKVPAKYNPRTLSGTSYAGKTILAEYRNGRLTGLPIVCQNWETMTYTEPTYAASGGGVLRGSCDYKANERSISDFLLPAGLTVVSPDIFAETENKYVIKPTMVRQKLKRASSMDDCASVEGPPANTPMPSTEMFGEMNMPPRPESAEVKVESGVIMVTAEKSQSSR